ncbi:hypothetical protein RF11_14928 [Thelohanellus kitauei]|uniref:Uncharacterized protein n=1 Tax=Thelohanellus kitauei TaxID=669202 RepID=A0A0C2JAD7_THEKT|nr:hypothetical protein RF11_14928 [Thelohanellus kitauei]
MKKLRICCQFLLFNYSRFRLIWTKRPSHDVSQLSGINCIACHSYYHILSAEPRQTRAKYLDRKLVKKKHFLRKDTIQQKYPTGSSAFFFQTLNESTNIDDCAHRLIILRRFSKTEITAKILPIESRKDTITGERIFQCIENTLYITGITIAEIGKYYHRWFSTLNSKESRPDEETELSR